MRRAIVLCMPFLLILACRQEQPAKPRPTPPVTTSTQKAAPARPVAVPQAPNRSTPDHCAGDGSYAQAVECYRQTSHLAFRYEEPKGVRAEGEMTRPTPGAERLRLTIHGSGAGDGEWSAEAKSVGVVWTRGGKRVTNEPAIADRMWQMTTLYLDPQKKEVEPQRDFTESKDGQMCVPYRFTDANSGALDRVWVSVADGHIVAMQSESHGVFPSYTMTITKMGK